MAKEGSLAKIAKGAAKFFGESKEQNNLMDEGWPEEFTGQLAIDVFQTGDKIIVKAPIAGVKENDIEVSVTDDTVTIKGERKEEKKIEKENYLAQECYWGAFSRTFVLPTPIVSEKAQATLKDGVLTIILPKSEKAKTKIIKVKSEQ